MPREVSGLDHLVLVKKWGISIKKPLNIICHTTQHDVCIVLHLSLARWFRINDCQSWNRRLPHNVLGDLLFAFRTGNRCAQIFITNFGWSCSYPMKLKSKAHKALPLLFQQDGVLPAIKCNDAKEMMLGEFNRKHKKALCHFRQAEPFILAAERETKNLKKGSGRKLLSLVPKRHFGMIALNLSLIQGLILQMAFTNWMGKLPKQLSLKRFPT